MNGNLKNLQSLTGKIKSFKIDTTLTKKGMCAESKAVGDALAAKVNISDIIDDLLSVASDKPLSANQGRLLKKLIDEIDPHYAENVLYNDTNVKDALDKVSKAENIAYDGDKSVKGAIDEVSRTLGYTVSKNLLKLAGVVGTSLTAHSVTITKTDENIYTLNGTSSNDAWIELGYAIKSGTEAQENYLFNLDNNKSYCASVIKQGTITNNTEKEVSVSLFDNSDIKSVTIRIVNDVNSGILTSIQGITRVWIYIPSGVTFNNVTLKLQLEEGTEVTDFEPYVADVQTQLNNVGRIVVDEYLSVSISAGAEAVVKSYSGLDVGVYMATFTAVGTSNSMMSAHIYLNNANIQGSRCFSNSSTASAQTNVATIFRITSARDVIHFKAISSAELTNREGQSIKIVRIA